MIHPTATSSEALAAPLASASANPFASLPAILPNPHRGALAALGDWRLIAWNLALILAAPVLLGMKLRKYLKKRFNYEFNPKRWFLSQASPIEPGKPHILFVGATYGEVRLCEPLIEGLRSGHPELQITIATRDRHTMEQWAARRPGDRMVLLPFDFIWPIAKFLTRERPDYVVFSEMYSFPNLVVGAKRMGSKLAAINARSKDFAGPSRYERGYYRWILSHFDAIGVQTQSYRDRILRLSRKFEPVVTGNLKLGLDTPSLNGKANPSLGAWLRKATGLPILAAGSSSTDEEDDFILNAFEEVRLAVPCRLLFAPRNLARAPKLLRDAADRGLTISRRSHDEAAGDVLLLDTMGELSHAYSFAVAAYVGGSLNGMGHNVLEPALHGVPVSYGPRRGHFEDIQKACEEAGVGFRLSTSSELAAHWKQVLTDGPFREAVRERAPQLMHGRRAPVDSTLWVLRQLFI